MNWQDEGFLLSKRKFRENANIVDVFTNNYGKKSGIVYGGNSRKIRNYLQISNIRNHIFKHIASSNKVFSYIIELYDATCVVQIDELANGLKVCRSSILGGILGIMWVLHGVPWGVQFLSDFVGPVLVIYSLT